jgi:N-acylneuraminate cytidylyltransferase
VEKLTTLAVIPARGGSKGIPRKNVRQLAGRPLIAYNIEQALRSRFVNRVVVSTDDAEIGGFARQYGAEVIWRPAEISGDSASSESALLHVLDHLRQVEGYQPDLLVLLQCTSPLTLAEDIDGTLAALLDQQADSALAVIPFHYFLWRASTDDHQQPDAVGINHVKEVRPLRQEREAQFLETGAVYGMRVPGFLAARHRFFGRTAMYVMPAERRLEIDDPVDFDVAEVLLRQQKKTERLKRLPNPIQAIIFDFDGVFTDNRVILSENSVESVVCNRSDGSGIANLKKTGLPMLILSSETNPVVQARAAKLRLPCIYGRQDKWEALQEWLAENRLEAQYVVYVGNDINDLKCMDHVGCAAAVADAQPAVLPHADIILENAGGKGAVREICDLILLANQKLSQITNY